VSENAESEAQGGRCLGGWKSLLEVEVPVESVGTVAELEAGKFKFLFRGCWEIC